MVNNRHANKLDTSDPDTVHLCSAVLERFLGLFETHFRTKKIHLVPPVYIRSDIIIWRKMSVRYKKGDFRNTADEYKALKNVAQWTHDENRALRGQPITKLEWKD